MGSEAVLTQEEEAGPGQPVLPPRERTVPSTEPGARQWAGGLGALGAVYS